MDKTKDFLDIPVTQTIGMVMVNNETELKLVLPLMRAGDLDEFILRVLVRPQLPF